MLGKTASWIGQVLVGRYEVTALVGSGGMAVLYRARDRNLGCDVAVKVPDAILLRDPTFAARFDREIRALVQLTHPHIVKISDVGLHDGLPFAVLQYLKGGSLRTRMRSGNDGQPVPMRPEELRGWLGNAAAALDFIHKRGFVHRDIKPDNILFDDAGQVYIGDFGIAKVVYEQGRQKFGSSLSLPGPTPGTPPYMAPELILGETYDGRADQFALAITVYELFVGGVPFDGATPTAIREQQKAAAAPLDVLRRSAPAGVAAAVQQALSYEPARRHKDCTAFARAVLKSVVSAGNRAQVPVALPAAVAKETPAVAGTVLQWISVSCPGCRTTERVKATAQGTEITCSSCGRKILVPSAAQAAETVQKQSTVPETAVPKRRPVPKSASAQVPEKRGSRKMLVGGVALAVILGGLLVGWQTIGEGKMPGWFKRQANNDGKDGSAQNDDGGKGKNEAKSSADGKSDPTQGIPKKDKQPSEDPGSKDKVAAIDSKSVQFYLKQGNDYYALKNYEGAIANYTKVLQFDSKNVTAHMKRGMAFQRAGDDNRAIDDYSEALKINPKEANLYRLRGSLFEAGGQYTQKLSDYLEAARLEPNRHDDCNAISWLLSTCIDDKVREGKRAVEYGSKACELTAWKNPYYFDTLAAAFAEKGDFGQAVAWQQKAILNPASFPAAEMENCRLRLKLYQEQKPYRQGPSLLRRFKAIAGAKLSSESLARLTSTQETELISCLLAHPETSYISASDALVRKHPDLILLVITSESMGFDDKKIWSRDLERINQSAKSKLRTILLDERARLDKLDGK